ncbi:hypothetical protein ACFQZE_06385 [Paenibacillus sp. GCM10027627]|uniref:hypothetical protein n=1 Tax=unclassified Paenibacillus TaxID=185978 RepID=UPI003629A8A2
MEKPNLNFQKIKISPHADLRFTQRLRAKSLEEKLQICKCILGNAKYYGLTTCDKGKRGHMFADVKMTIILHEDLETIVTVYETKSKQYIVQTEPENPLHDKLKNLYETELRRYERTEQSKSRKLERLKLEIEIEKAELKYKIYKTKSHSVKNSCTARLHAINNYIHDHEKEIKKIQNDKRKIARAMACIV